MINLLKGSLQDELDGFFKTLCNSSIAVRKVTKMAFCKARKNLKHTAFIDLNNKLCDYFYHNQTFHRWHGFRLLSIDGTRLRLPNIRELAEVFGITNDEKNGFSCPSPRVSQCFDVLNGVTIDAQISPLDIGERTLATESIQKLGQGDLLLLDRGYPAFWLFALMLSRNVHFCVRVKVGFNTEVKRFIRSRRRDKIITLHPNNKAKKDCNERGIDETPIKLRLIKVDFGHGNIEILMTSLLDNEMYPYDLFKPLYHMRWSIEERYKFWKSRVKIEKFTGKSVLAIKQDFFAKIFTSNLCAVMTNPLESDLIRIYSDRKDRHQINLTQALSKLKNAVVLLLSKKCGKTVLSDLLKIFLSSVEPIRDGRSYSRDLKSYPVKYFPYEYSQLC